MIAGQAEVLGDERGALCTWPPPRQRGRGALMEQAAPGEARLFVDQRAELLVREVVHGLCSRSFAYHSLRHELLQRTHRFLVASPARVPHGVKVEGPADGRRGAEHLTRHVAEGPQAGVEDAPHLRRQHVLVRIAARAQGGEVLGDEQRQTLALHVYAARELGRCIALLRRPYECRDLTLGQPRRADDRGSALAHKVRRQAAEPVTGRHRLAAPRDREQQRARREPASQVGDRADGRLIRCMHVVQEDKPGLRPFTSRADHRGYRLDQAHLRAGPVERERIGQVLSQFSQLGQEQRGIRDALRRQRGRPAVALRILAASRSSSTTGP